MTVRCSCHNYTERIVSHLGEVAVHIPDTRRGKGVVIDYRLDAICEWIDLRCELEPVWIVFEYRAAAVRLFQGLALKKVCGAAKEVDLVTLPQESVALEIVGGC